MPQSHNQNTSESGLSHRHVGVGGVGSSRRDVTTSTTEESSFRRNQASASSSNIQSPSPQQRQKVPKFKRRHPPPLLHLHEIECQTLHSYLSDDNPYLLSSYPPHHFSLRQFFSHLHNETLNVLTHAVPILLWCWCLYQTWSLEAPQNVSPLEMMREAEMAKMHIGGGADSNNAADASTGFVNVAKDALRGATRHVGAANSATFGSSLYSLQFIHQQQHMELLQDKIAISLFLLCAIVCMGFSVFYHVVRTRSHHHYRHGLQCDLMGIVSLVAGSNLMYLYFQWKCLELQWVIGGFIFIVFCWWRLLKWIPKMVRNRLTTQRTVYFAALALCVFLGHWFREWRLRTVVSEEIGEKLHFGIYPSDVLWGVSLAPPRAETEIVRVSEVNAYLLHSAIIGIGMVALSLVVKALKLPERLVRHHFDVFGSSHQLFHIFAAFATYVIWSQMFGLLKYGYLQCPAGQM